MQPALFACTSLALARAITAANLEFAVSEQPMIRIRATTYARFTTCSIDGGKG
jgi:hypothetical protein